MSVKKQAEKKIQREKRLRLACEQELTKFREYCTAQEQEIELLRGLLRKHGIEFDNNDRQPPVVSTIDVIAEVNQIQEEKPLSRSDSTNKEQAPATRSESPSWKINYCVLLLYKCTCTYPTWLSIFCKIVICLKYLLYLFVISACHNSKTRYESFFVF